MQASSDGRCYVVVETSQDGTTWTADTAFPVRGGASIGLRFIVTGTYWRVKVYSDPAHGAGRVYVSTQLREPTFAAPSAM